MPRSDGELMVAFQEGDQEAFALLYDRHTRALMNFFYKMCFNRALAEDLMQDTFLKVIRHRGKYRPEAAFKTFLYTVARNLWIDRHRSQKSAPKTVSTEVRTHEEGSTLGDLLPNSAEGPVELIADREAAELVRRALLDLPEAQRLVFVMAEAQGMKYREGAGILGGFVSVILQKDSKSRDRIDILTAELEIVYKCPKCGSKKSQPVFGNFYAKTSKKS